MQEKEQYEGMHILKRDGSVKPFDPEKIVSAVSRAGKATQEFVGRRARRCVAPHPPPSSSPHGSRNAVSAVGVKSASAITRK